jgi:transposase
LRRDFHELWTETKSEIAREALDHIGALYDIEREIAGKPAAIRLAVRQQLSKPKVEGKHPIGTALKVGRSCGSVY